MRIQKMLQEVQEERSALQKMSEIVITSSLLFNTPNMALHQVDEREEFILTFFSEELTFRACELIAFKKKLKDLDILDLLRPESPDVEIIPMPHCDRILVLTLGEILELRSLLSGSFSMLELNSLIHREIIRKAV